MIVELFTHSSSVPCLHVCEPPKVSHEVVTQSMDALGDSTMRVVLRNFPLTSRSLTSTFHNFKPQKQTAGTLDPHT